jgi:hypothetical protein
MGVVAECKDAKIYVLVDVGRNKPIQIEGRRVRDLSQRVRQRAD